MISNLTLLTGPFSSDGAASTAVKGLKMVHRRFMIQVSRFGLAVRR